MKENWIKITGFTHTSFSYKDSLMADHNYYKKLYIPLESIISIEDLTPKIYNERELSTRDKFLMKEAKTVVLTTTKTYYVMEDKDNIINQNF